MDYQRTTTTVTAPAAGPLDLNATRPTFRELGPLFGLTLITLFPIALGGALVLWSLPREGESFGGWNALGSIVGALFGLAGVRLFWPLSARVPRAVSAYYDRIDEWHYAQLDKFQASDGQITATQIDERYWYPHRAPDMLMLFLYVWLSGKTPTVRGLSEGPLMVNIGHRSFVLGRMTQDSAEVALQLMARADILLDRGPRQAGRVAMLDPRKAVLNLLREVAKDPRAAIGSREEE